VTPGPNRTRTLRGAVSGVVAAAIWALQQPLDKAAFGSRYDDVELLGRAVTRGDGWYPLGLALHLGNGAVFGAVYANVAPTLPIPPALRGPFLALAEHAGLWPLVAITDRLHPAREQLPRLNGNRAAWLQAAGADDRLLQQWPRLARARGLRSRDPLSPPRARADHRGLRLRRQLAVP